MKSALISIAADVTEPADVTVATLYHEALWAFGASQAQNSGDTIEGFAQLSRGIDRANSGIGLCRLGPLAAVLISSRQRPSRRSNTRRTHGWDPVDCSAPSSCSARPGPCAPRAHSPRHRHQHAAQRARDDDVLGTSASCCRCLRLAYLLGPPFSGSPHANEQSPNAGGLPVYPANLRSHRLSRCAGQAVSAVKLSPSCGAARDRYRAVCTTLGRRPRRSV